MIKIEQKILATGIAEKRKNTTPPERIPTERPYQLMGATYRINSPLSEHAIYVTINDIVLNAGTAHEIRRPFEVFINSKAMEHFQWIVGLTRVLSSVFRAGGDALGAVQELRSVFDPRGGYFQKGGRWVPSLIAEIGYVLESHISGGHESTVGVAPTPEKAANDDSGTNTAFPEGAFLCQKCLVKAVVVSDGCTTCMSCGDSKCG